MTGPQWKTEKGHQRNPCWPNEFLIKGKLGWWETKGWKENLTGLQDGSGLLDRALGAPEMARVSQPKRGMQTVYLTWSSGESLLGRSKCSKYLDWWMNELFLWLQIKGIQLLLNIYIVLFSTLTSGPLTRVQTGVNKKRLPIDKLSINLQNKTQIA